MATPDLPVLRTSYPGLADGRGGGDGEIRTLWIPSKASMLLPHSAGTLQEAFYGFSAVAWSMMNTCVRGRCENSRGCTLP